MLVNWLEVILKLDVYVFLLILIFGCFSGNLFVDVVWNISKWLGVCDVVMVWYSFVFVLDWGCEVELMVVLGDIFDGK